MAERVIVDASAMVDLLIGSALTGAGESHELHAPAHLDAEVLCQPSVASIEAVTSPPGSAAVRVDRLAAAPIDRHVLWKLLAGAWKRRHNMRLVDALYVELAEQLDAPIVTTDGGMAASPAAELFTSDSRSRYA